MIVGQFCEAFPPINDGAAQVVKNYAYWLNKMGDDSYAITAKNPGAADNYDFEVLRYNSVRLLIKKEYRTGIPQLDRTFCNHLKTIDFYITHSHSPFSAGKLGLSTAKRLNIPCVMTFHTKFKDIVKNIVKTDFMTKIVLDRIMHPYNLADDVWTVSQSTVETLREYGYKGDIYVVENACDFEYGNHSEKDNDIINDKYSIPKDTPVFLFVGRMEYHKNVKLILKALKILHNDGYDYKMLMVGYGDKLCEFKKTAASYGLKDKIIFTGNINDRDQLKLMYLRSSAILFPSISDMSSLVIKEAAAMKRPAILIKGATTSEGVTDGENGFLIENDERQLANKTEMIIDNPAAARQAGENAYKTLYISWEQAVKKARQRYEYLIDRHKKRRSNA